MSETTDDFLDKLRTGVYIEDETINSYLKLIGSSTLDQLLAEPSRLNSERDNLEKQTRDLAFTNYNTFIQSADCSRQTFQRFNDTEKKLDSIILELPDLKLKCQHLSKISEDVNKRLNKNHRMQAQSGQLLDVLELPDLMESCIRHGHFEQALELFSYMRRLGAKHANISVISSIVKDLEGSWRGMVHQLLDQLRSDLPLPKCLQVMGFLRRMDVYSDPELRLKFLQTRDAWLRHQLSALNLAPGESVSMKKLEVLRVQLFNIITQYRAMFSDDDISLTPDPNINEACIIYTWITEQVSHILSAVEEGSTGKQGDSLESILAQTMYFGLSFGRVGVDFRGLVAVRVQRAALASATSGLKAAGRRFEQDMARYVLAPGSVAYTPPMSSSDGPPFLLLEFPPLAEFTNGLLRVFNDLRSCALLSIANAFTCTLHEILIASTKVIVNFYKQEETALGPGERASLSRFCQAYQALLTYLAKALSMLFPLPELALHLGLPVHQLQSLEIISLKESIIIEPLKHLLPTQVTCS